MHRFPLRKRPSLRRSPVDRLFGLPAPTASSITVHEDIAVPMRDGVVLLADHYVPDGDETAPVVLIRSPYGRKGMWWRLFGRPFAARGYQVVFQSCRGTQGSGGDLTPLDERDDGLDTVKWLREQPWYPGQFATFGASYMGLALWALVDAAPAELAAMAPIVTSSRFARSMFVGGAMASQLWLEWSAAVAAQRERGYGVGWFVWSTILAKGRMSRALRHLPLGQADRVAAGRTLPWWQTWMAHPEPDDEYWQRFDHSVNVSKVTAPVLMVTGWYDAFLPWQLADWAQLDHHDAAHRLVIGPWMHMDPSGIGTTMRETVAWFDTHVHRHPSRLRNGPVRYYVTGADQWRDAPTWPPPDIVDRHWFMHSGGGLSSVAPDRAVPPSEFRYDPGDPTPRLGGPAGQGRARVQQDAVEARSDVLTFTTTQLPEPLEVLGTVTATVHLRSSAAHTDVVVRLCDVDRTGRSTNVCEGITRISSSTTQAGHDGVSPVTVDLWPTAHRFREGHRIRVQIASAAFPWFARNPGTGELLATATRLVPADQEVLHDPAHPTHLTVPTTTAP